MWLLSVGRSGGCHISCVIWIPSAGSCKQSERKYGGPFNSACTFYKDFPLINAYFFWPFGLFMHMKLISSHTCALKHIIVVHYLIQEHLILAQQPCHSLQMGRHSVVPAVPQYCTVYHWMACPKRSWVLCTIVQYMDFVGFQF